MKSAHEKGTISEIRLYRRCHNTTADIKNQNLKLNPYANFNYNYKR
jgi:hypothetical protein